MIRLYPEQLSAHLQEGLRGCYLLSGNDPLLLQESQDAVCHAAHQQGFTERLSFVLDRHSDWQEIFSHCQALSLFSNRQFLLLQLPENGVNAALSEQLVKLSTLLHPDILLLLRAPKLSKAQENSAWFNALSSLGVYITCLTPEHAQLPRWVSGRAKQMRLQIDEPTIQLLCYCYEGNLLALKQALQQLALIYPDGKLTLPRVESVVADSAHFTAYHWLDALLAGKSRRAWHILHQLQLEGFEPLLLLRTLQPQLLLLLQLQRGMKNTPLRSLFDSHKVWQNRRPLLSQAVQRITSEQLAQAISQLTQLELSLKQDYDHSVWQGLETLSLLLCGKLLPTGLLYNASLPESLLDGS